MGLPRHDGEVEGVVMEDDAVLVLFACSSARPKTTKLPFVFHECFRAGCLAAATLELVDLLGSAVDILE